MTTKTYEEIIANRPEMTFAAFHTNKEAVLFTILDKMSVDEYTRLVDDDTKKWFAHRKWWYNLSLEERGVVMNNEFRYD